MFPIVPYVRIRCTSVSDNLIFRSHSYYLYRITSLHSTLDRISPSWVDVHPFTRSPLFCFPSRVIVQLLLDAYIFFSSTVPVRSAFFPRCALHWFDIVARRSVALLAPIGFFPTLPPVLLLRLEASWPWFSVCVGRLSFYCFAQQSKSVFFPTLCGVWVTMRLRVYARILEEYESDKGRSQYTI